MICAPWASAMFSCASDGNDHTECCASRDVPDVCNSFCGAGGSDGGPSVSRVDYRHFGCVPHLPTLANCMLNAYGVLPSEPRNFRFSNIGVDMGLLHWDAPLTHGDSIK